MFLGTFDTQIYLFLIELVGRSSWWIKSTIVFFARHGDVVFIALLVLVSLIYIVQETDPKHGHLLHFVRSLVYSFLASIASLLNVTALKNALEIPRPFTAFNYVPLIHATKYSFPSGHAATFMCMALVSGWYIPKYRMFFLVFAIFISLSRVLAGVHTPLDILAGWVIGGSFAFLVYIHLDLIKWVEKQDDK